MIRIVLALSLVFLLPFFMWSAEVTDVADAFDKDDPVDVNVEVMYLNTHNFASIKKENNSLAQPYELPGSSSGGYYPTASRRVETLEYSGNPEVQFTRQLILSTEIGLFKDLSIKFTLPIILKNAYKLLFEDGTGTDGQFVPNVNSLVSSKLFPEAGSLYYDHSGVGDLEISVQWAPYSQERGDFFSWLVGFGVTFPTGAVATPRGMNARQTSGGQAVMVDPILPTGKSGNVGTGLYVLTPRTAISKQYSVAEPYFQVMAHFPIKSSSSIIDDLRQEYLINLGSEFVPYERKEDDIRIMLRFDLGLSYTTRGNAYNFIADARWIYDDIDPATSYDWKLPSGENKYYNILPMEDPAFLGTLMLKTKFRVWKYIEFGTVTSVGYRQKHYLTSALEGEAGYINGLDNTSTPWRYNPDASPQWNEFVTKSGGRLSSELNIEVTWGAFLTGIF